jgi:hypothetical protein
MSTTCPLKTSDSFLGVRAEGVRLFCLPSAGLSTGALSGQCASCTAAVQCQPGCKVKNRINDVLPSNVTPYGNSSDVLSSCVGGVYSKQARKDASGLETVRFCYQ